MTSSRLRSLPSARLICNPSPLPPTAIPAESYPRYSSRLSPSRMTGTTRFLPTYPTIPHIASLLQNDCGKNTSRSYQAAILQLSTGILRSPDSLALLGRFGRFHSPLEFDLGLHPA